MENTSQNRTLITKHYGLNRLNLLIAVVSALIMIALGLLAVYTLNFSLRETAEMSFLLMSFYALLMFILAIRRTLVESKSIETKVKFVEKFIEKPLVERVVIHEPAEPKTRTITKIINKVRTIKQKSKKLNIPHYKFVGSSVNKVFHTHNCRLGKLIKKKYKISHNTKAYYLQRKFKPCKVCILKQKKV